MLAQTYLPFAYTPSLSNRTISFPSALSTFATPLPFPAPPNSNVPPLIRSASIVPATIKSAKNPCPVPNVLHFQSLPSAVRSDAISNPSVPKHIAPNVGESGSKSSNNTARTVCFFAMDDCALSCALTPLIVPCTCCPIRLPSERIACSTLFMMDDTLFKKLYWNFPRVTEISLFLTASHSNSMTLASDTILSLECLQWTVSPSDTASNSFTSSYSSVFCRSSMSALIVIFGLSTPAAYCSSHFFLSAPSSCSCVSQMIVPFVSSSSEASARIFTSSKDMTL